DHRLPVWHDPKVGPLDGDAGWTRDAEHPARSGISFHQFGKPNLHVGRIGQKREYRFGGRVDANLDSHFVTARNVAHFVALLRSAASAACFSRRTRGRQNLSMNAQSPSTPPVLTR